MSLERIFDPSNGLPDISKLSPEEVAAAILQQGQNQAEDSPEE